MKKFACMACLVSTGVCAPAFASEPNDKTCGHFEARPNLHVDGNYERANAEVRQGSITPKPAPAVSWVGWVGVGTATTGLATLVGWSITEAGLKDSLQRRTNAGAPADFIKKQRTARAMRVTGTVAAAIGGGLVLFDLVTRNSESSVAVRFGKDGMPRLRWRTRF